MGWGEPTKKFSGLGGPTARGEGRVVSQEIPILVEGVGGVKRHRHKRKRHRRKNVLIYHKRMVLAIVWPRDTEAGLTPQCCSQVGLA